jgi:hypothetical protein
MKKGTIVTSIPIKIFFTKSIISESVIVLYFDLILNPSPKGEGLSPSPLERAGVRF